MQSKYVLLVCPILKDGRDIGYNPYLGAGEFIQAKMFVRDGDVETGLYGMLWGKCPSFNHKNMLKSEWAVVKTEVNENLLRIDLFKNQYKFKRGLILHMGKIKSCANFVMDIKDDATQFFAEEAKTLKSEEIIGTKEWSEKMR